MTPMTPWRQRYPKLRHTALYRTRAYSTGLNAMTISFLPLKSCDQGGLENPGFHRKMMI